ncbi:hypothetical protein ACTFIZ_011712 [Dictyostelium cf. discoideum]
MGSISPFSSDNENDKRNIECSEEEHSEYKTKYLKYKTKYYLLQYKNMELKKSLNGVASNLTEQIAIIDVESIEKKIQLIIGAIKELKKKNISLEKENTELKNKISEMEKRLNYYDQRFDRLENIVANQIDKTIGVKESEIIQLKKEKALIAISDLFDYYLNYLLPEWVINNKDSILLYQQRGKYITVPQNSKTRLLINQTKPLLLPITDFNSFVKNYKFDRDFLDCIRDKHNLDLIELNNYRKVRNSYVHLLQPNPFEQVVLANNIYFTELVKSTEYTQKIQESITRTEECIPFINNSNNLVTSVRGLVSQIRLKYPPTFSFANQTEEIMD